MNKKRWKNREDKRNRKKSSQEAQVEISSHTAKDEGAPPPPNGAFKHSDICMNKLEQAAV